MMRVDRNTSKPGQDNSINRTPVLCIARAIVMINGQHVLHNVSPRSISNYPVDRITCWNVMVLLVII